jgi:hypothetical protein
MDEPGLLELATAEDENAKRVLFKIVPLCHAAAALLTILALFVSLTLAYVLAVVVLVCQAAVWLLRRKALGLHRLADQARRRALLIDALGETKERLDVADLRGGFSKRACEKAEGTSRPNYWGNDLPQGPERLLRSLQESAFWSKYLYDKAARRMIRIGAGVLVALALVALLGYLVFSGNASLAVPRVLVVVLSFFIGLDVFGQAFAWQTAAKEAAEADRRLDRLDTELQPMLAVVADYAIATSSAAPIPDALYKAEHDRLNKLWSEHRAGG